MVLSFSFGFKGSEVRRSGFSPAAGQKTAGQIEKETVPFWRGFIQAAPLAASAQSDLGGNFVNLYRLFLDCGSGF